jgi:hypothetical protein
MNNDYKTVCDTCFQPTWYETEQPCKRSLSTGCETCGSHEYISKESRCTGTLRVIDNSKLASKFTPFYRNRQRIIVKTPYGDTIRGYVGKTTGWKPLYLLILKSNSTGSSEVLSDDYEIVGTVNKYR